MKARIHLVSATVHGRTAVMVVLIASGLVLPVIGFGVAPAEASTVVVSLDCGSYNGTTFPVEDVTAAQGDTIAVTWDADCRHPGLDHTVLNTDKDVATAYFSSVPGQSSGVSGGDLYIEIVPGSSGGEWVLRYDAPLGQMPLNTNMDDSWPYVCSNCSLGSAIRLTITPGPTVPAAPESPTGTVGDGLVVLNWAAPLDDGGSPITEYIVTASPGGSSCTAVAPATSCTVNGLKNGAAYTFTVSARNAVGSGPASAPSVESKPAARTPTTSTSTTIPTPTSTSTPPTPAGVRPAKALSFAG